MSQDAVSHLHPTNSSVGVESLVLVSVWMVLQIMICRSFACKDELFMNEAFFRQGNGLQEHGLEQRHASPKVECLIAGTT